MAATGLYGTDGERMELRYIDQAIRAERRDIAKILLLAIVTLMLFTTALWGVSPEEVRTKNAETPMVRTGPDSE